MAQHFPAMFVAGSVGLDFLNSVATPVDVPVDWIDDGEGLLAWLAQAQLIPDEVLKEFRRAATAGELDAVAAQARSLRELFRSFVAATKGHPLNSSHLSALEPLNRLLARDQSFFRILPRLEGEASLHRVFEVRPMRRWTAPESLLQPLGEALARLVSDEDFTYVKACEGPACTLLFVDHTKGHRRRWCSMAVCGNRAKQLAHYYRRTARE
jgi:predicted RNA-binding Zn ribbon-like protein